MPPHLCFIGMDQAHLGARQGEKSARAQRLSFVDGAVDIVKFSAFATESERGELLEWALSMRPYVKANPEGP